MAHGRAQELHGGLEGGARPSPSVLRRQPRHHPRDPERARSPAAPVWRSALRRRPRPQQARDSACRHELHHQRRRRGEASPPQRRVPGRELEELLPGPRLRGPLLLRPVERHPHDLRPQRPGAGGDDVCEPSAGAQPLQSVQSDTGAVRQRDAEGRGPHVLPRRMHGSGGPDELQDLRGVLRRQRPSVPGGMGGDGRVLHRQSQTWLRPELRLDVGSPVPVCSRSQRSLALLPWCQLDRREAGMLVGWLQGPCKDEWGIVRGLLPRKRPRLPRSLGGEERFLQRGEDAGLRGPLEHLRPHMRMRVRLVRLWVRASVQACTIALVHTLDCPPARWLLACLLACIH
mmetsp:Transcript_51921/g.161090  ORF Transcript_51921/g.161090 Transcript_51921/m.161090 type:complete len:344 (+) Transcript_51921:790-1821(+)